MPEVFGVREENWRDADVHRWNSQALSTGQLARVYGFTDTDGSQPDAWAYMRDSADKSVDPGSYR